MAVTLFAATLLTLGDLALGATPVPIGMASVRFSLDRSLWLDQAAQVSVSIERSDDAGGTWQFIGGFTSFGGTDQKDRFGVAPLITHGQWDAGDPTNPNRLVRGIVTVSGTPFTTSGVFDFSPVPLAAFIQRQGPGSVSIPAQTVTHTHGAAVASITFAYTSPSGLTNPCIHVGANLDTTVGMSTVTYGGDALTKAINEPSASWGEVSIWRRVTPQAGSSLSVVCTITSGTADIHGGAITFAGVHQTTPERSTAVALNDSNGTSPSLTIGAGNSDPNDWTYCVVGSGSALSLPTQTEQWLENVDNGTGGNNAAGDTAQGSASAITYGWTNSVDVWRCCAVSIRAAAAAANAFEMGGVNARLQMPRWSPTIIGKPWDTPVKDIAVGGVTGHWKYPQYWPSAPMMKVEVPAVDQAVSSVAPHWPFPQWWSRLLGSPVEKLVVVITPDDAKRGSNLNWKYTQWFQPPQGKSEQTAAVDVPVSSVTPRRPAVQYFAQGAQQLGRTVVDQVVATVDHLLSIMGLGR
jgi:hypothetical protein